MSNLWQELNNEMSMVVNEVRSSLVQISNGRGGAGAGAIWHADGLIVTNHHVIAGRSQLKVTLPDGVTLPARVLAEDAKHDLAALSVQAKNLPVISLGDSHQLQPGQWVLAVGHPWGVTGAVTAGIVIATGIPPELLSHRSEFIQVGLHLRLGHSGGPLVDARGRLVGINSMITGPEVGLAVPVHVVKEFLREALGYPKPKPTPTVEYL